MRVLLSNEARTDIKKIKQYLIDFDFDAKTIISQLLVKIDQLTANSGRVFIYDERYRTVNVLRKNTVIFHIDGNILYVDRVFAGRQDWSSFGSNS